MITERDLWDAIKETEQQRDSYAKCQKLATYYTLLNYLYPLDDGRSYDTAPETMIGDYGETDFLSSVSGREASEVWRLMDELMSTLQIVYPRLYDGVMRKLNTKY